MFRDKKKAQCRRARGMLGDYIDGRLGSNESLEIERHVELCEACAAELKSLGMTVQLLHEVPAVPPPRSFAIRETQLGIVRAPARREWGWLKPVTAAACVLLLFFVAGDFSGIFPGTGEREAGILSSPDKSVTGEGVVEWRSPPGEEAPGTGDTQFPTLTSPLGPVDEPGISEVAATEGWPLREIQIGLGALIFALVCTMLLVRRRRIRA